MMREFHYDLEEGFDPEAVLSHLESVGLVGGGSCLRSLTRVFYDSTDGRLFAAGRSLALEFDATEKRLVLADRLAPLELASAVVNRPPGTGASLPAGRLWQEAARVLEDRLLEPRLRLTVEQQAIPIQDEQGKTVVRLLVEHQSRIALRQEADGQRSVLRLQALRGYPGPFTIVADWLEGRGMRPGRDGDWLAESLGRAEAAGRCRPGAVDLDAREPVERVLRRCLHDALRCLSENERRVIESRAPHGLHDLRTVVRSSRGLLKVFRDALPGAAVDVLGADLAWLASITGPARDLDVQCARFADLIDTACPGRRDALAPMLDWLEAERRQAYARLVQALCSDRFRRLKRHWRALADETVATERTASETIARATRRAVRRSSRRLVQCVARARAKPSPRRLHRLRKEVKRLRYLLTMLRALFPPRPVERVLRRLWRAQDRLGRGQDLMVQTDLLRRYRESLAGEAVDPALSDALTVLDQALEQARRGIRRDTRACLAAAGRRRVRRRLRRLADTSGRQGGGR